MLTPNAAVNLRFALRDWFRILVCVVVFASITLPPSSNIQASTLPTGFTETILTSGLTAPTAMAIAPDGRIFVTEQGGTLRVIKFGSKLTTPFITLTVDSSGERGLLGIAFDPNFTTNHYLYLYYTVPGSPSHNRVSRFTANGDVVVPASEVVLLEIDNLSSATNHNGGPLHFGPDGKLYIGVGENATGSNSQTLSNMLGKLLRINSDGTIPTDNPFFGTATGNNRAIWALGLRNPYTFDFQRGTGRLFINDVGQSALEEIDDGIAGSNYGWPTCEGPCTPTNPSFRDPLYTYGHSTGSNLGCAITGGAFYNPSHAQFPSIYTGKYFFADLCGNWINVYDPVGNASTTFVSSVASGPVDLKVGADGALYYLSYGGNSLRRIQYPLTETIGVFRSSQSTFYLRNSNTTGSADITTTFGITTDLPVTGDWNGDGIDTVGVYRPSTGQFFLRDSNTPGASVAYAFTLGSPSDLPMAGDWNGDGVDGVGVFRPSNGLIFLKNTLTTGFADYQMVLGVPGDKPVAGDWNSDGTDSPGVYRPGNATFFLSNQVCNCSVTADYTATLGIGGDSPFVGDWNTDGTTSIGVFRPSNGLIYLRNTLTTGVADVTLVFGTANDTPVAGHWAGAIPAPIPNGTPKRAPTFVP